MRCRFGRKKKASASSDAESGSSSQHMTTAVAQKTVSASKPSELHPNDSRLQPQPGDQSAKEEEVGGGVVEEKDGEEEEEEEEEEAAAMESMDPSQTSPPSSRPLIVLTDAEGLSIDHFTDRHGEVVAYSDLACPGAGDEGSRPPTVSPFADPVGASSYYDDAGSREPEDAGGSSYWSFSSSDDSSSPPDSSSDSSDDDSSDDDGDDDDEMDFIYDHDARSRIRFAEISDGFVSFPALDEHHNKHGGGGMFDYSSPFFAGMDPEDVRDAQELLVDEDGDEGDGDDGDGLVDAIEAVTRVYGGSDWSRPLPRWAWLKSSNSVPVLHLGPNDFRHGRSKLRKVTYAADDATSSDGGSPRRSTRDQGGDKSQGDDDDDDDDDESREVAMTGAAYA